MSKITLEDMERVIRFLDNEVKECTGTVHGMMYNDALQIVKKAYKRKKKKMERKQNER